jgi:hypothetical protein
MSCKYFGRRYIVFMITYNIMHGMGLLILVEWLKNQAPMEGATSRHENWLKMAGKVMLLSN